MKNMNAVVRGLRAGLAALLAALIAAAPAAAAVPDRINFQGRLLDQDKLPRNGTFSMSFKICDSLAADCSSPVWSETQSIGVANGVFSAQLGANSALSSSVFSTAARYLEISVAGETLSPRERLVTTPYSFRAAVAESVGGFTGNRVLVTNAGGDAIVATITDTELGYLSGVSSNLQTQLGGKQATITGAATTITASDLTINRALLSDGSGKVAVSGVTNTELGYLSGVTSALQTQLGGKQATVTGAATTITGSDLTINRALLSDGSGKVGVSAVTNTELGYLSGVTSAIQTQLGGKEPTVTGAATTITGSNLTTNRAVISDGTGKIGVSAVTDTELGYVSGVTSALQTQLNGKAPSQVLNTVWAYTATAGTTWNYATAVAAGVKAIFVEAIGGGGGGGSGRGTSASNGSCGGGGGGGGYAAKLLVLGTDITANATATAGTGGPGGAAAGFNGGTAGTASTFVSGATLVSAGGGGLGANTMTNGATVVSNAGGAGGVGTVGTILKAGADGDRGVRFSGTHCWGGTGGAGARSGGGTAIAWVGATGTNMAGVAGKGEGGGGGGAAASNSSAAGGAGADGIVIVWEFK